MQILHSYQFDRPTINEILEETATVQQGRQQQTLAGKIMATLFFEPSTRTRFSFETAMIRLGGSCITVAEGTVSSAAKGETLEDTIKTVSQYADVIVVRHPEVGALSWGDMSDVPLINAGDGDSEHPTQALLDLFTIRQHHGTIDGLNIMISGDLKHSRTTKSLLGMLLHYDVKIYLHHPVHMGIDSLDSRLNVTDCEDRDCLKDMDVLYMVRPQKERWSKGYTPAIPQKWAMNNEEVQKMKGTACILHPLPRNDELPPHLDSDPRCLIWSQVRNGVSLRAALLLRLLKNHTK